MSLNMLRVILLKPVDSLRRLSFYTKFESPDADFLVEIKRNSLSHVVRVPNQLYIGVTSIGALTPEYVIRNMRSGPTRRPLRRSPTGVRAGSGYGGLKVFH